MIPGRSWLALFLLVLGKPAFAQLAPDSDPWLAAHAFVGSNGCLIVSSAQHLSPGDRLVVFRASRSIQTSQVLETIPGDSAKAIFDERHFEGVYHDAKLWRRVGCWWALRGASPPSFTMASYTTADTDSGDDLPLAIHSLPKSALPIGGNGTPLTHHELESLLHRVVSHLPRQFASGRLLLAGQHFGHDLVELDLGKPYPERSKEAHLDSVRICRCFLQRGHLLALQRFQRVSGQEEHEGDEGPELDASNWNVTSEETLGFLSLDGGASWNWLSEGVGSEGIQWKIVRLTSGLPARWSYYLYTFN